MDNIRKTIKPQKCTKYMIFYIVFIIYLEYKLKKKNTNTFLTTPFLR